MKKNYYFVANNPKNIEYLNHKSFDKNDIVIIFNKSLFENHYSFKNAFQILHFYRSTRKDTFHGIENIHRCNCTKLFFIGIYPFTKNHMKKINRYDKHNIIYNYDYDEMLEKYEYKKFNKVPQTGSLTFEYLKKNNIINKNTKIFLIGFNSIYKQKLWNGHSKELEDSYFKLQIKDYPYLKYENNHLSKV